jgi:biopolymer transport protein TolQ
MNVFLTAYSQSDFFGKLIFLGLYALSILCWIILIQKVLMTRNVRKASASFQQAVEKNKKTILSLELKKAPHPFAVIFTSLKDKTTEILDKNHYFAKKNKDVYLSPADLELIESHVLTSISTQSKILDKNIFMLSTIATLGPFLGLLGTVWGILITFSELHAGGAATSNSVVLGGLSTALVTTVLGLLIAIPAIIAYNYLKNSVKTLSSDMEDFLYQLLSHVELQYRKADTDNA